MKVRCTRADVGRFGAITETDVGLAEARVRRSWRFNVVANSLGRNTANQKGVEDPFIIR